MTIQQKNQVGRVFRATLLSSLVLALLPSAVGCLDRPVAPASPRTSNTLTDQVRVSSVDKIDLLFMIDNSASMADKQKVLAKAVPDLVNRLINPVCVKPDAGGKLVVVSQPAKPDDACPDGSAREFSPINDIHIGVVTSSMGGHGSDLCVAAPDKNKPGQSTSCNNAASANFTCDDKGRLINRGERTDKSNPTAFPDVSTYKAKDGTDAGFFAWDPKGKQDPPGDSDAAGMITRFTQTVLGTDQIGCGYEASLEAWYRFLVDPRPPAVIKPPAAVGQPVSVEGVDEVLLKQRADFLRPDSLVAVVNLSDENDCSIMDGAMPPLVCDEPELDDKGYPTGNCRVPAAGWPAGYAEGNFENIATDAQGRVTGTPFPVNYLAAQQKNGANPFHLKSGTSACASDPNSPACKGCYISGGDCTDLTNETDSPQLRCWNHKKRFGTDFLYPLKRYVDGLSNQKVYDRDGFLVTNPLFDDLPYNKAKAAGTPLKRSKALPRDARLVFYASIVGVPWQDIARDPKDLTKGYKPVLPTSDDPETKIDWSLILGDPATQAKPKDPLMEETNQPRSGTHPVTNEAIGTAWNSVNGHEWNPGNLDLQYACIFPLQEPRECEGATSSCDCAENEAKTLLAEQKNPLCEGNTADGKGDGKPTTKQLRAKAYPGTRFLQVAKDFGQNAIVASICTPNLTNDQAADFGYRPAVAAIIDRLKTQLAGRCLPRQLAPNPDGTTPCLIIDAQFLKDPQNPADPAEVKACQACDRPARKKLDPEISANLVGDTRKYECLCEVTQIQKPGNLNACRTDKNQPPALPDASEVGGWCYVDPAAGKTPEEKSAIESVVEKCPDNEKRTIRFVNAGIENSTLFITCLGAASGS